MATPLDKVRAKNPKYAGFGDKDLVRIISAQTGDDFTTVSSRLGIKFKDTTPVVKDPDIPAPGKELVQQAEGERYSWADRSKMDAIRSKNPRYKDLSDHGLLQLISHQTGDDLDTVAVKLAKQGKVPEEKGLVSELGQSLAKGFRDTGRMLKAGTAAYKGDTAKVESLSKISERDTAENTPKALTEFNAKLAEIQGNESLSNFDKGLSAAKEFANNPRAAAQFITQQLPNMLPVMAPAYSGFLAGGAVGGPVGAVVGGISGLALGNIGITTGEFALEKAQKGNVTPEDLAAAKKEGVVGGAILTGVDTATLGLGHAVTKTILKPVQKATARAEARVLMDAGVDMSSKATIDAALKTNPQLMQKAMQAGSQAFKTELSATRKSLVAGTNMALQTVGEGAGEAAKSLAVKGKIDPVDVVLESLAGAGMSTVETAFTYSQAAKPEFNTKQVQAQADRLNDERLTSKMDDLAKATNSDEAIKAAQEVVNKDVVTAGDIWDGKQAQEDLLKAITSKTVTPSTTQNIGGLGYAEKTKIQETEQKTGTDVLRLSTERQLAKAEARLKQLEDRQSQSTEGGLYLDSSVKFLRNHIEDLQTQLTTGEFQPRDKTEQLKNLINTTLAARERNPELWTENDQKLITLAQKQIGAFEKESRLTEANQQLARLTGETDMLSQGENLNLSGEPVASVETPPETAPTPGTPGWVQQQARQNNEPPVAKQELSDEQFVDHVVGQFRNPLSGQFDWDYNVDRSYEKELEAGNPTGLSEEQYREKYLNVISKNDRLVPQRLNEIDKAEGTEDVNYSSNPVNFEEEAPNVYENIDLRGDTTEVQLELGKNVYQERVEKIAEKEGGKVVGLRISKDFKEAQGTVLVGQEVKDVHELAHVAQILRDPRFETLRVFYVKNNKIVGHYGLTSRLPGTVAVNKQPRLLEIISSYKMLNGADGYYLMHNHPSGRATPSTGDMRSTNVIADRIDGFLGHVIVDSNEYGVIDTTGGAQTIPAQFKDMSQETPLIPHDALNVNITEYENLAELGKLIQAPRGFFSVVGIGSDGKISAISEMPDSILDQPPLKIANKVRLFARHTGSRGVVVVTPEGSEAISNPALQDAVDKGVLFDVVGYYGDKVIAFSDFPDLFKGRTFDTFEYKRRGAGKVISVDQSLPPFLNQRKSIDQPQAIPKKVNAPNKVLPKQGSKQAQHLGEMSTTPVTQAEKIKQTLPPERDVIRDVKLPEETKLEKTQRLMQDELVRVKVLQDFIEQTSGKKLSEHADVYTRENLSKAVTANLIEDFNRDTLKPLLEDLAKNKIAIWEIAEYLEMRHIPEANARMRKIHGDPDAMANEIPDDVADNIRKEYEARSDFNKVFKPLADKLWNIGKDTLDYRLKEGLISQDQYNAYNDTYKFWVPLRGDRANYNIKGKVRTGHQSRDEFVFENLVLDRRIAIMQAQRNRLGMSVIQFLLEADRPDIGTVAAPVKMMTVQDHAYQVVTKDVAISAFATKNEAQEFINQQPKPKDFTIAVTNDPQVVLRTRPMLAKNEMEVYVGGHRVRVQINDELMQRALIGMGEQAVGAMVEIARSVNRYLSKSYTSWSPDFILTNIARDLGGGTMVLAGEKGTVFVAKTLKNYPAAIAELIKDQKKNGSSKVVNAYRRFGGNTGAAWMEDIERVGQDSVMAYLEHMAWQDAIKNQKEYFMMQKGYSETKAANAALLKVGYAKILRAPLLGHFLRTMEVLNSVAENALRVATFKTAIEQGLSAKESAALAKNLMNFNRHGETARQYGALYMFYNPGMQGVHLFGKTFFTSEHKEQAWAMAASMAFSSFLIAELMRAGDEDDEQKWKDTPKHVKERNLVVSGPGDMQLTIPVPYGFGVFHNFGNLISDLIHGEDSQDLAWNFASSLFSHFVIFGNPFVDMQGNKEIRPELMLPTLAKMAVAPATNVDGLGRPVMPFKYDQSIPDSATMTRSVRNTWYEGFAGSLNEATGGDKFTPGAIDISPNTLKYWVTSLTGGWGRALTDTAQLSFNATQGVAPETSNTPVVRKFIRQPGVEDARGGFYEEANKIKAAAKRFSRAAKENDITAMNKMLDERGDFKELSKLVDSSIKETKFLRDEIQNIQADKTLSVKEKDIKIKQLEKDEAEVYKTFFDVMQNVK